MSRAFNFPLYLGDVVNHVPDEAADDIVSFVVRLDEVPDGDTMSIFRRGDGETGISLIPVDTLRANLAKTAKTLQKAFEEFNGGLGVLRMNEVQVGLEITATGGVHLIGTAGIKGAITLIFRDLTGGTE